MLNTDNIFTFISSALREGYQFSMEPNDFGFWSLWDSDEYAVCKGVVYDPEYLLSGPYYFICDIFDGTEHSDFNLYKDIDDIICGSGSYKDATDAKRFTKYTDCILKAYAYPEDFDCQPNAQRILTKLENGEHLFIHDFLGKLVGAGSSYTPLIYGENIGILETTEATEDEDIRKLYEN